MNIWKGGTFTDINKEGKSILVGIDLTDDFTQLSYYTESGELFSVSLSKDPMKYRIPTVLCAIENTQDWLFGDEAVAAGDRTDAVQINDLLRLAREDDSRVIFGQSYTADMLLERYLKRLLGALKIKAGAEKIRGVVIAVKTPDDNLKRNVSSALELLGIRGNDLKFITHLESFMYYVVSQNKDIWVNDVGLFDFDTDCFKFYRLSFGRRNTPITIVAESSDLTARINYSMFKPEEMDRLRYAFEDTASMILHKQLVSALYFTGAGFDTAWADDILKKLCNGRRIFRGQNLYVKGAGYAAGLMFNGGAENYFPVGDDVLKSSLSIRAFSDGAYREVELAGVGQRCSEAGAEVEVILDHTNELDFIVHNVLKKDFICAIMTLDTLNLRSDRSVRLNIKLSFPDRDTCVITVRDAGFGEIYRTTHKIWEQVLKI